MAQENREPVSDQDFFSQYLQPTGTPATGKTRRLRCHPRTIPVTTTASAPQRGSAVPQADPFGAEASPPSVGPTVPDAGFDGRYPAAAYPAPRRRAPTADR